MPLSRLSDPHVMSWTPHGSARVPTRVISLSLLPDTHQISSAPSLILFSARDLSRCLLMAMTSEKVEMKIEASHSSNHLAIMS